MEIPEQTNAINVYADLLQTNTPQHPYYVTNMALVL